jgi:uncharacterized membrane protein
MLPASDSFTLTRDPVWPWSLSPLGLPALLLVAVALTALTVWTYAGVAGVSRRRLAAVVGLRLAALVLACLVLVRPSFVSHDDRRVPSTLLFLLDASESMTIQDEFDNQSRWDYLRRVLGDCQPVLEDLQDSHNVTVATYRFGEDLADFNPEGKPDGKRTDFGQALRTLYERHGHDRNLRGLVILSDGADNGTRFPALAEAARWRALPCPIYTFGLGKSTTADRQRDIALVQIAAEPASVAVKGKMTIKGTVDAPGFEDARVKLRLLIDDKEVLTQDTTLPKTTGNEVRLTTDAPARHGEVKVTLKVDPLPGEITRANNEISTFVTVTQEGISVLFVDKPRFPEPQLICDALSPDPRIRLYVAWLRSDRPTPGLDDLFQFEKQHYDVIILGDVSARLLAAGRPDALAKIRELVAVKGAGLMMMGGYETFGNGDWNDTPIDDILPVRLDVRGQVDERWKMKPTPAGLGHYIMRLTDSLEANRALWDKLPKLDGLTRLGQERRGATVLAVREGTEEPVLVSEDFGEGRTLAFAGDTTWRWQRLGQPRSAEGVEAHAHFWRQVVFWLAKRDKAEGNVWIKPDGRRLPAGSKLGFTVGLRGKGGIEAPEAHFEAKVVGPQGTEFPLPTAREADGERGTFWKTDAPGEYRLVVRGRGKDVDGQAIAPQETSVRFLVYQDDAELMRRAADHDFLTKLAVSGGGNYSKAEKLPAFLRELVKAPVSQARPKADLWPDWRRSSLSGFHVGLFTLFVALLGAEWLLRRWWGMV